MTRRELQYAIGWAVALMALTCLPYLFVQLVTPPGTVFPWILFNSDDQGVYYAWIHQAKDGHFLFRNLFTNDPQLGLSFHLYFLILGWLARLPFLGIAGAAHLGRIAFGVVTLVLVYRLASFFTADVFTRRCAFWCVAVSAGLGWLSWSDHRIQLHPVDVWQPEAFTFPSLYTNGLFCISMALMLGVVICLLLAEEHGWRWAVGAGLCGAVLANIHSYDIIHLTAVWAVYLVIRGVVHRRFPLPELGFGVLASALIAPVMAYMYWLYQADPVFHSRVDTETLSPEVKMYVWGFGLLIPLAAWGAALLWRGKAEGDRARRLLLVGWAVVGPLLAYAPVAFQRKLVMGTHFPLAILSGIAVAEIARRAAQRLPYPRMAGFVAGALLLLLSISNLRYLERDVRLAVNENVTSTGIHPAFWREDDVHAFEWLGQNTPAASTVLIYPLRGVLVPAFSDRTVFAGHWGETPNFYNPTDGGRVGYAERFYRGTGGSEARRQFLAQNRIDYVIVGLFEQKLNEEGSAKYGSLPLNQERFLAPVFHQGDTTVYRVDLAVR